MITLAQHIAIESEDALTPAQKATGSRLFADLSTDELRARAVKTDGGQANWHLWTREMLLAFHHNRFGRYVPS